MPITEVAERPDVAEDFYISEGVRFTNFEVAGGQLQGTTDDGRTVEVEMIHRRGSTTFIHYYDEEGEARIATRKSGTAPARSRTY